MSSQKNQTQRAFRFTHPDLDPGISLGESAGDDHSGMGLDSRGILSTVESDNSVRQSVLMLLSTRPGERLMRPTYGCNLFQLVFAPNDETTAAIAVHHVRRALQQWEPRINIITLAAHRDAHQPGLLVITLKYQVRTTQRIEQIQLSLDLTGEES